MISKIYKLFGEIFENAQYIEWNIALITCKSHKINALDLFKKNARDDYGASFKLC